MGLLGARDDTEGRRVACTDPSGGTFDAAGDYDRLIPADDPTLPNLSAVDPYVIWTVPFDRLPDLASEVSSIRREARPGPEERFRVPYRTRRC